VNLPLASLHGFFGAGFATGHLMNFPLASLQGAAWAPIGVAAIAQQRAQLYAAWQQARANCLQLTSGEPNDDSPCKAEVGAD